MAAVEYEGRVRGDHPSERLRAKQPTSTGWVDDLSGWRGAYPTISMFMSYMTRHKLYVSGNNTAAFLNIP